MPDVLTPTQRLAEAHLRRPLAEYLSEKRNARPQWSWRLIAEQLAEDTGNEIVVSHETVRQWFTEVVA